MDGVSNSEVDVTIAIVVGDSDGSTVCVGDAACVGVSVGMGDREDLGVLVSNDHDMSSPIGVGDGDCFVKGFSNEQPKTVNEPIMKTKKTS